VRSTQNAKASAAKLQPMALDVAPQLANVILNTKNSFLSLRNNGDIKSKRNIKTGTNKPLIIQHYSSVDSRDWEEQYQAGCHLYVNKTTGEVSIDCPWRGSMHQAYKSKQIQETVSGKGDSYKGYCSPSPARKSIRLAPMPTSPAQMSFNPLNTLPLSPTNPLNSPSPSTNPLSNVFISSGSSVVSLGSLGISSGRYQVYDEEDNLGTGSLVYERNELDDMISLLESTHKKKTES
jgi:hypothetical protein